MSLNDFNHTIDLWIGQLARYDMIRICAKPSPASWSVGQVYMHVILQTEYFIGQAGICLSNNDNATGVASPAASIMFFNNAFPDEILEGPPDNSLTPQPRSKEQLTERLKKLREGANDLAPAISISRFNGKTRHPGLAYFNAEEWLQFAEMHMRHHLRQKRRVDDFLGMNA